MSKIIATGSYLPDRVVTNQELIQQTAIDSSDEWITQRTGIKQRHFATDEQTVSDLAVLAAQNLLQQVNPKIIQQIEMIIVTSMSSGLPTPSVASQVQRELGILEAWSFDISGACSGFTMAVEMAEKLSRDKTSGYTLVIGADKMSAILNFEDRGTSILFGDGAGAILIQHDGEGLKDYESQLVSIPDPDNAISVYANEKMTMDGRLVFNFVLRQVIPSLANFIQTKVGSFDYLISHQANKRFFEVFAKKLTIPLNKIPTNISQVANTSGASIPLLLDQLVKSGEISLTGEKKVVLVGYGAGLSWGQMSFTI